MDLRLFITVSSSRSVSDPDRDFIAVYGQLYDNIPTHGQQNIALYSATVDPLRIGLHDPTLPVIAKRLRELADHMQRHYEAVHESEGTRGELDLGLDI